MPKLNRNETFIPENLGGTDNLYDDLPLVGSVQVIDGFIAMVPIIATLYATPLIPDQYAQYQLVLIGFGVALSATVLIAKPDYLTLVQWLSVQKNYRTEPDEYKRNLDQTLESVKTNDNPDTREQIGIEKIYPNKGVVEKPDGKVVGYIKMSGVNLDILAGQAELENHAFAFKDFLESQVEDDIQFSMPMRQYDPSEQVSMFNSRLDDPEVDENPFLVKYLFDRMEFHEIMAREGFYRQYYCLVETEKHAGVSDTAYKQSGIESVLDSISPQLRKVYVSSFGKSYFKPEEIKQKQIEVAQEKTRKLASGLDGKVAGNATVLDSDQIGVLLKEFWSGKTLGREEEKGFVRQQPIIMGAESLHEKDGDNSGD